VTDTVSRPRRLLPGRAAAGRGILANDRILPYILVAPAVLVVMGITAYPTVLTIYLSFTQDEGPRTVFVGLDQYRALLSDSLYLHSLRVTGVYTIAAVVLETVLGFLLALLLHQRFPGRAIVRSIIILPMAVTPIAAALGWRIMYNSLFGVINYLISLVHGPLIDWLGDPSMALSSVLIIDIWEWTPFVALIMLAGLQLIPDELLEAARIDGAHEGRVIWHIVIPYIVPIALIAVTFRLIDAIRTFDTIYGTTGGGPGYTTETVNMYAFHTAFEYGHIGYAAAMSLVVLLLLSIPVSFLYKRVFRYSD
jgi:multiple sugar transport system permease protein